MTMPDLSNVTVVQLVDWLDERPQCTHLLAAWNAGGDTGNRCEGYGRRIGKPSPRYCPINGGLCAMDDPNFLFQPGWDKWARWCAEEHGHIEMNAWPGIRAGMLGCYVVAGDCMSPTWGDGDLVVARMGDADFRDGAACVISRRVNGLSVRGKYLKRLERIGEGLYYITADNPTFAPVLVPAETVRIRALVLEGTNPAEVLDQLAVCYVFDGEGHIVPTVRAVNLLR